MFGNGSLSKNPEYYYLFSIKKFLNSCFLILYVLLFCQNNCFLIIFRQSDGECMRSCRHQSDSVSRYTDIEKGSNVHFYYLYGNFLYTLLVVISFISL
jgi:hypothetical protein